jgi:hypothetical protein
MRYLLNQKYLFSISNPNIYYNSYVQIVARNIITDADMEMDKTKS